jgi:hypothetical protein
MSEFLPYILGSVASGMIGGLIGARRKQVVSGVVWGALLGPVGWIIVILLPHRGARCPACGGVLGMDGATKCMHCAVDLPQPVSGKPATTAPQVHPQAKRPPATMPRPGKARKG